MSKKIKENWLGLARRVCVGLTIEKFVKVFSSRFSCSKLAAARSRCIDPPSPSSESFFSTGTTPTTQIFRLEECSEQHPEINRVVGGSRSEFTFIIGKRVQLLVLPIDLCYYWVHLIMFLDKVGRNGEFCAISSSATFRGIFFRFSEIFACNLLRIR